MRSSWATIQAELNKWAASHAGDAVDDPELASFQQGYGQFKQDYSITAAEEADPGLIDRVPHPGGLLRKAESNSKFALDPDRLAFLKLLRDSFYGSFSEDSHMMWPSVMLRGAYFIKTSAQERKGNLDVLRQYYFTMAAIFLVIFLSEIELQLKCGFSDDLKYVWTILSSCNTDGARIYDFRYKNSL